jgi:hypothetical protein
MATKEPSKMVMPPRISAAFRGGERAVTVGGSQRIGKTGAISAAEIQEYNFLWTRQLCKHESEKKSALLLQ